MTEYDGQGCPSAAGAGSTGAADSCGQLIKEYHFKPGSPWMTEPLFQRTADNQLYYYQNDHLGTPQTLLAKTGAVVWAAHYSAFGEAFITTNTIENNLRFPGQYYDAETSLHYNYFRDYNPLTGRYIQQDPIGLGGGLNAYSYAYANPYAYTDPNGLNPAAVYWRCIAQCIAWSEGIQAVNPDPCFTRAGMAKDCALSCLNPLNWISFKPKVNIRNRAKDNSQAKRRAAREAQRHHGTPTSRSGSNHQDKKPKSPRHQTKEGADGTLDGIVDGSKDTVPSHGPHIEVGKVKSHEPFNKHNQPRLQNGKSKVEY